MISHGCFKKANCATTKALIEVDGVKYYDLENVGGEFGFYFCIFRLPGFHFLEKRNFNTYGGDVQQLIDWIDGLKDGTVVISTSRDEATFAMTDASWAALVCLMFLK